VNHRADAARNLAIYLNDHWAGSVAGQELSRHLVARNREWAPELVALAAEIRQERRTLRALKSTLGIGGGRFKGLGSVAFAFLGRLKTNASGYSALSRLEELEALLAGVSSKRGLWVSLQACAVVTPQLHRFDLASLEQQAVRQAETLRNLQARAAAEAFQ